MSTQNHQFHLVDYSPWPLTGAIGALTLPTKKIETAHSLRIFNRKLFQKSQCTFESLEKNVIFLFHLDSYHNYKSISGIKLYIWVVVQKICRKITEIFFWDAQCIKIFLPRKLSTVPCHVNKRIKTLYFYHFFNIHSYSTKLYNRNNNNITVQSIQYSYLTTYVMCLKIIYYTNTIYCTHDCIFVPIYY